MAGGTNGPAVLNGAPFSYPNKTLKEIRLDMLKRMGYSAMLAAPPTGINELLNSFIFDAHEQLYYRFPRLRRERWWTIQVTANNRFYDIPYDGAYVGQLKTISFTNGAPDTIVRSDAGNFLTDDLTDGMSIRVKGSESNDGVWTITTVGASTLQMSTSGSMVAESQGMAITISQFDWTYFETLRVNEVWLKDSTRWCKMISGIPTSGFTLTSQTIPTNFEIREYIEIWPEPETTYELYIKGDEGLRDLQVDTDPLSVNPRAVFLMALANAKAHYGHPDARIYFGQLEVHIGKLNAGTFNKNDRFIPDKREMEIPPLSYPNVVGTGWSR